MFIVVLGAAGQLGTEIVKCLKNTKDSVRDFEHEDLDVTDPDKTNETLSALKPDCVINCTAYNRVDDASVNNEIATKINFTAVENIAKICRNINSVLVHFSTDYVFNGKKGEPYLETDTPAPVNSYGISKLLGENSVAKNTFSHYIIRTSGVYGKGGSRQKGGNFVEAIIRKSQIQPELRVVNDQTVCPTYAKDLAETACRLIRTDRFGLYHATNSGSCTWYEFACAIIDLAKLNCKAFPITSSEYPQIALRPKYSVLANTNLAKAGLPLMRHWREALADYIDARSEK